MSPFSFSLLLSLLLLIHGCAPDEKRDASTDNRLVLSDVEMIATQGQATARLKARSASGDDLAPTRFEGASLDLDLSSGQTLHVSSRNATLMKDGSLVLDRGATLEQAVGGHRLRLEAGRLVYRPGTQTLEADRVKGIVRLGTERAGEAAP